MYRPGRKFFILFGLIMVIGGVLIIVQPAFYSSYLRQYVDLTEVKWQVGCFFIAMGILFIWSSSRREAIKAEEEYRDQEKVLICPFCVKPFQKKDTPELKCPICEETLEDLVGFYERYPELKDKKA
jgi:hypothetical protein